MSTLREKAQELQKSQKNPDGSLRKRVRTRRDRWLDFVDRSAARVIVVGGALVVISVLAIVVFIGAGALPLFRGASVSPARVGELPYQPTPFIAIADESQTHLWTLLSNGVASHFTNDSTIRRVDSVVLDLDGADVTCASVDLFQKVVVGGDFVGRIHIFPFEWRVEYTDSGAFTTPHLEPPMRVTVFDSTVLITQVAVAQTEDGYSVVALGDNGALNLARYNPDFVREEIVAVGTSEDEGVTTIAINQTADRMAVGYGSGKVQLFDISGGAVTIRDTIQVGKSNCSALSYLLGGTALAVGNYDGEVSVWLPKHGGENGSEIRMALAHEFTKHGAGVSDIVASSRDRSFVSFDVTGAWKLHHSTAQRTYHEESALGATAQAISLSPKGDGVVAAFSDGRLATWRVSNPHPEATIATLFSGTWYEGYDGPEYIWQSSGGSDENESKLSLIPLVFGTIKGALYSLLFSIPIAIFAAIYVSQLSTPGFRAIVKPVIELMAALPSVVVGFLAALWLAPFAQEHLVGVVMMVCAAPLFAIMAALLVDSLSARFHSWRLEGKEFLVAAPFVAMGIALAYMAEPWATATFFGGDVNQWLYETLNVSYDQRNCLVIGFALGFAVIPIIFTVAEDALSSVPRTLVSGALALGATRWQATWKVVLRSASPGIFAAIMLGFGRAVGETMIVLMATGNTPIMDWSIFNGMRTMSAAIAVETPEAAVGGTLYRTLFLIAFLLFIFTLIVNTLSSFIGAKLRRRYGRF